MAHDHVGSETHSKNVVLAFAITVVFMVVEASVGFFTGSLVLVADAGHMLTDAAGLSLALIAIWLARRPANAQQTYGYSRSEILAALVNVLLLIAVSAYILFEAAQRPRTPEHVSGVPLIIVASIGLCVNGAGAALLVQGSGENLNLKASFLDNDGRRVGRERARRSLAVPSLNPDFATKCPQEAAACGPFKGIL